MYGIRNNGGQNDLRQRLETLKTDTRTYDNLQAKFSELEQKQLDTEKRNTDLEARLNESVAKLNDMEALLFGDGSKENKGIIGDIKNNFEMQRTEYSDLIATYVESSTPRLQQDRLNEMTRRIEALESRPKVVLPRSASSVEPSRKVSDLNLAQVKK